MDKAAKRVKSLSVRAAGGAHGVEMINDGKYFAFAFGLALACFTSSAHAAPPAFSDTFPWQRTPTMCQTVPTK